MYLKRHYEPAELERWQKKRDKFVKSELPALAEHISEDLATKVLRNRFADEQDRPSISHVSIKHAGDRWNPSQTIVQQGIVEGWLSVIDGRIILKTAEGESDVRYRINRAPGRYSCFNGQKLGSEAAAKEHVTKQEGDSPDPQHPSGYVNNTYYECAKESDNG